MKPNTLTIVRLFIGGIWALGLIPAADAATVAHPADPTHAERLAAQEVRRYLYLRTGTLLPLQAADSITTDTLDGVVVAQNGQPLAQRLARVGDVQTQVRTLGPQQYFIKTIEQNERRCVLIIGGDGPGLLYGVYRFAEHLGIRFYLHGDVVPDERMPLELPVVEEICQPLFELRGIQPFHDFPEGPDWWNVDDYKAIISQLPKLGMNFIGLHTYPEGHVGPEPMVWIGTKEDIDPHGKVTFSYPARHFTTVNGTWGYRAKPTSDYALGAAAMFDRDAYGARIMTDMTPWPATPAAHNEMFERFAAVLREAFSHAHRLGIKTCIGTETPLIVPKEVRKRLEAAGKKADDPAVVISLYEGMFRRIAAAHLLDYYWLWTPEGWTWSGATPEQVAATTSDLKAAIAAIKSANAPFTLATCGWVLGPPSDPALFDRTLPKDMPMSCINRQVGKSPVEPGFADVTGRPQWAIPWMEDDPNMISPQLWAGRMRRDAFDALRYGCTGLMGIHWRTRVLGPNVAALAQAAWDQSEWETEAGLKHNPPCSEGVMGGNIAVFANHPIEGTEDDPVYQAVRYNLTGYRMAVPNGAYTVTLKFCEPHYSAKGKRAFGVKIEGRRVLDKLDIFEKVGQNKVFDRVYKNIEVVDGQLAIDFMYQVEFPCIAGVVVEGVAITRKINCGGPAYKDFEADLLACPTPSRDLPADDFYADWARTQFGADVGGEIGTLFARLDGRLVEPATWVKGPGGILPDPRTWDEAVKAYAFVEEFAAFRPRVQGAGSLERFDYWLDSFRYMRATARTRVTWSRYNDVMKTIVAEQDVEAKRRLAREQALPIRRELIGNLAEVYRYLLATVKTSGEMK